MKRWKWQHEWNRIPNEHSEFVNKTNVSHKITALLACRTMSSSGKEYYYGKDDSVNWRHHNAPFFCNAPVVDSSKKGRLFCIIYDNGNQDQCARQALFLSLRSRETMFFFQNTLQDSMWIEVAKHLGAHHRTSGTFSTQGRRNTNPRNCEDSGVLKEIERHNSSSPKRIYKYRVASRISH